MIKKIKSQLIVFILIVLFSVLVYAQSFSHITNTGIFDISGNLTIIVQKASGDICDPEWVDYATAVDEAEIEIIEAGRGINIATIWDEHGGYQLTESGRYRLYAIFTYHGDGLSKAEEEFYSNEFDYIMGEEPIPICEYLQECIDSDGGLDYETAAGGIGQTNNRCEKTILPDGTEWPAIKDYTIDYDKCKDDNILEEVYCENNILKTQEYYCPFGCYDGACLANVKDHSKYSEHDTRHAFLISNIDPNLIQELQSLVKWTENEIDYEYPLLIYNGTNANEIIDTLNQLEITKLTAITDPAIEGLLDQTFQDSLSTVQTIELINQQDYFSYWLKIVGLVYVEDNPLLIQQAAKLTSSLNAPLVIQGTKFDTENVFENKYVICIGNSLPEGICEEYKE
ncbi:hypothetical protein KY331_04350 [Candidatus Woesearchaeota archaeon]|nr:hypothetical protein [Candidatus Woesearchaeota archaeon]